MAYEESNGHVTDDVTWARKVKLVTPICLEPNISKTAGDRDSVSKDHQYEMTHGGSYGHVTGHRCHMTQKGHVVTPVSLESNIVKTDGVRTLLLATITITR